MVKKEKGERIGSKDETQVPERHLRRKGEHCDAGQLEAQSGKALSPTPPRRGDFVTWNCFPSSQPHTNRLTAH